MITFVPTSAWAPVDRARYYLAIGYSAKRVAQLFGVALRVAETLKREGAAV
jgi:hypothetical protein